MKISYCLRTRLPLLAVSLLITACGTQPTVGTTGMTVPTTTVVAPAPEEETANANVGADATAPPDELPSSPAVTIDTGGVPVPVQQWVTAVNDGDADAFEATLAANPVVTDSGRTFTGLEAIRTWSSNELLGAGGTITIECTEQSANGTILNVRYASSVYNGPGRYVFVLNGDAIQSIDMVAPVADACTTQSTEAMVTTQPAVDETSVPALTMSTQTSIADDSPIEIPTAAQCYVDAVNATNLDQLVACFADDGLVVDVSRRISGPDAIRTWADNEVIGGTLRVLEVVEQREGHVRLLVHWAPGGSNGWQAYYTFDYQDGRITEADLQYA